MFTASRRTEPSPEDQFVTAATRFARQQAEVKAQKSWWGRRKLKKEQKKKEKAKAKKFQRESRINSSAQQEETALQQAQAESRQLWRDSEQYKRRVGEVESAIESAKYSLEVKQGNLRKAQQSLEDAQHEVDRCEQEIINLETELDESRRKWGVCAAEARHVRGEARKLKGAQVAEMMKQQDAVIFEYEKQQRIMLRGSSRWWLYLLGVGTAAGGIAALLKYFNIF